MREANKQVGTWNAARARAELEQWESSGQTMAAFSRARGYPANRLSWWKGELRRREQLAKQGEGAATAGLVPRRATTVAALRSGTLVEATISGADGTRFGGVVVIIEPRSGVRVEINDAERVGPRWVAQVAAQLGRGG